VNVGAPEEYNLPLQDGLQGQAIYYKNKFGEVVLSISLSKSGTTEDLGNGVIGWLPEGFRPRRWAPIPCMAGSGTGSATKASANLNLQTDGRVELYTSQGILARSIIANGSFLAAQ